MFEERGAQIDAVDEEALAQKAAREGKGDAAPLLQSPLRQNELNSVSGDVRRRYSRPLGESVVAFIRKVGRITLQLALIVAVCMAADKVSGMLPVNIPGNILSMVFLLVFLAGGVIKMESISEAADFLLDNMAIFFVPAAVAVMGVYDTIAPIVLKLLGVTLVTTVIVFFVTSFTVTTVSRLMERGSDVSEARKGDSK